MSVCVCVWCWDKEERNRIEKKHFSEAFRLIIERTLNSKVKSFVLCVMLWLLLVVSCDLMRAG